MTVKIVKLKLAQTDSNGPHIAAAQQHGSEQSQKDRVVSFETKIRPAYKPQLKSQHSSYSFVDSKGQHITKEVYQTYVEKKAVDPNS